MVNGTVVLETLGLGGRLALSGCNGSATDHLAPLFSVNIDSKELNSKLTPLDATVTDGPVSIASKGVADIGVRRIMASFVRMAKKQLDPEGVS